MITNNSKLLAAKNHLALCGSVDISVLGQYVWKLATKQDGEEGLLFKASGK